MSPERIGPYELVRRLGAGGMAETFVARRDGSEAFRPLVCLKRVLPALADDAAFLAMLRKEAELGAALRHRSIVRVLDFGVDGRVPYLVLEWIDGVDLRRLMNVHGRRGERLPTDVIAWIGLRLAEALEHAHSTSAGPGLVGLVHRDLSPANVLLATNGEVKLSDFGIAKAFGSEGPTRTAALKGKIPYMAPEYAHTGRADPRADLFALGVVLFECLAGRRPYRADGDAALLAAMRDGDRPPLEQLAPGTPAPLAALIDACLAPDPDARPRDAAAVVDALAAHAPRSAQTRIAALVAAARETAAPPPTPIAGPEPSIEVSVAPPEAPAEPTAVATHHANMPLDAPPQVAEAEAATGTRIDDRRVPLHDPSAPTRTQIATARVETPAYMARRAFPWVVALVGVAIAVAITLR